MISLMFSFYPHFLVHSSYIISLLFFKEIKLLPDGFYFYYAAFPAWNILLQDIACLNLKFLLVSAQLSPFQRGLY